MNKRFEVSISNFTQLEMRFTNKDILTLRHVRDAKYYGFKAGELLELSYGEYSMGYGENGGVDKEVAVYTGMNTQFFPIDKLKEAIPAFMERLHSEHPWKLSTMFKGYTLEECLKVDDTNQLELQHA